MNKKTILIGLGVLAVAGIGYYMWKKKNENTINTAKSNNNDKAEGNNLDEKIISTSIPTKKYNLKDIGFPAAMVWNGGQDFTQTSIMPSEMPFTITGKEMTAYNIPLAETSVLNKGKSVWVNKTALQPV